MQRGSDMVGIWLHYLAQSAGIALAGLSLLCAGGMVVAAAISYNLGRSFSRRQAGTK
jgi:hypothetical protein